MEAHWEPRVGGDSGGIGCCGFLEEVAKAIWNKKAHDVLGLKQNHSRTYQEIASFFRLKM